MNSPSARSVAWLVAAALLCCSHSAFAKDKWDDAGKSKQGKEPVAKKTDKKDEEMKAEKKPEAKADAAPANPNAKIYRFKAEKKAAVGGSQVMTLSVEDAFTGKMENLPVPNNDAASKEYDPLTAVAGTVKDLKPGDIIEVETEKQKGRAVVKSVAKAEVAPGEELPNGFIFVESDEQEKNGMPSIIVTLKKFGREVKVGVPFRKDNEYEDAKWEPEPKIDYVVRRLQSGTVVEALFRKGKTPMLAEIYEYRPPERGKFVGLKEVEFNNWPAAGFEIQATDGTNITFTLEGTEYTKNSKTVYTPNPQQLASVKKLKPDTEVEVRYRLDGRTWVLREVKVLAPPPNTKKTGKTAAKTTGADDAKKDDAGKMQDEKKN